MGNQGGEFGIGKYSDFDEPDGQRRPVAGCLRADTRHVHRDGDHSPEGAWPRWIARGIDRIELQHLTAHGEHRALAGGQQQLLMTVPDDAECEHARLRGEEECFPA